MKRGRQLRELSAYGFDEMAKQTCFGGRFHARPVWARDPWHLFSRLLRKGQCVSHRLLEGHVHRGLLGFGPGDLQYLRVAVDAAHLGVRVLPLDEEGERGRAAADVEDAVAAPDAGLPDEAALELRLGRRPPDDQVVERRQQVVTERRLVFV